MNDHNAAIVDPTAIEPTLRSTISPEGWNSTIVVDQTGIVRIWNAQVERVSGIAREAALGRPVWEVAAALAPAGVPYEQAVERSRSAFSRLSSTPGEWWRTFDLPILRRNGQVHWVRSAAFPVWVGDQCYYSIILCEPSAAESAAAAS